MGVASGWIYRCISLFLPGAGGNLLLVVLYHFRARAKNGGWRIDYFCVSECLKDRLRDAKILTDVMGSDHCPVELDFE